MNQMMCVSGFSGLLAAWLLRSGRWCVLAASFLAPLLMACTAWAQLPGPRNGLSISIPNGFPTISVDDLTVQTTAGPLTWARRWNGREWKFNPQWESLSQSWKNATCSQASSSTADGAQPGAAAPDGSTVAAGTSYAVASSSSTSEGGYWVWVEDGYPVPLPDKFSLPVEPQRYLPFNQSLGPLTGDYLPPVPANVDLGSLCAGSGLSSGVTDQEGLRRINELYTGQQGLYAFNSRNTIEKRAVRFLPAAEPAALYAQLSAGRVALNPGVNAKGYRWADRSGSWVDYATNGQVVALGDRNDNTIWLVRDTEGLLRGVVDGNGRVLLTLHYTDGLITEVRDYPLAGRGDDLPQRTVKYGYDTFQRLTGVTDVRGGVTSYAHAGFGAGYPLSQIVDPAGQTERLTFSPLGVWATEYRAPDGSTIQYSFNYDDVNKQFLSVATYPATQAGSRVEKSVHNRAGQLVKREVNGRIDDQVVYDTANRAEVHTNARGFRSKVTFNEFAQVAQLDQADGTTVRWTYSALHLQPVSYTNEAGTRSTMDYDARGNLLKRTDAAGLPEQRVTLFERNALGQATRLTLQGRTEADASVTPDASWQFEYDAQGQVSKTTDPEGNTRLYTFDRAGNLTSQTDPRGNTTRYASDAAGNLTRVTDALGRIYTFAYDKLGNLSTLTDARGKATLAAYDAMNRLVQSTNAVGGIYKRQYDAMGQMVSEVDEDGVQRTAQFDTFQRLTQIADGLGNLTKLSYQIPDGSGAGSLGSLSGPTEIQYPTFTQRQRYDPRERPTASTLLNPSSRGGVQTITGAQSYDKLGALTATTDAAGKQRLRSFDALGQPVQFTDALGSKTQLEYDARGNLLSLTDANGNTHRFAYDRNDRLLLETLPMGQKTRYQYDAAGNLSQRVDALGNKALFSYDAANRLSSTKRYDANGTQARDTTLTWDESDNLTAWSDTDLTRPAGQQTSSAVATYDDANRKTAETTSYPNPAGGTYAMSTGYAYSPAGRKTQLLWPDGSVIGYGYSLHGVLQSVQVPGEGTISVNSYNWAAPAKITLPGGTTQQTVFDGLLKQESLRVANPAQQPILSLDNYYGVLQELKSKTRTDANEAGGSSTTTTSYAYDDEVRLTKGTTDKGTGTPDVETFTLDVVANRTAHSKTQGTWTYDANNRLLQSGTGLNSATYQWDEAGRLTRKTEALGRVWQYGYDIQDRLNEVRDGQGNLIARYGFDPLDRRVWKEQYRDAAGDALNKSKRSYFNYSDEGLIAQAFQLISLSGSGSAAASQAPFIQAQYGPQPDSLFTTGYLLIRTRNSANQDTTAYFHRDHIDTPLAATQSSGLLAWQTVLSAFGEVGSLSPSSQSDIESSIVFPGQYRDEETRLHYNYRRTYDPSIGRYVSPDPIGLAGGVNRYAYVSGDPVNSFDPTGECGPLCAYAGCVVGGIIVDAAIDLVTGSCFDFGNSAIGNVTGCAFSLGLGKAIGWAAKFGREINIARNSTKEISAVIGRTEHLKDLRVGEKSLLSQLKGDLGSPKANWKRNAGVLRAEMRRGVPIRDASPGNTDGPFLNAERHLLRDRGWSFDPITNFWMPPKP